VNKGADGMNEEIREFLKILRAIMSQLDILMAGELNQDELELVLKSVKTLQSNIKKHVGENVIE
jgi:hypothetical protein